MIEIIPNWHPIWVHFAIGLLGAGTLFYTLTCFGSAHAWSNQALVAAHWNLISGTLFTLLALWTGWLASGTVTHDDLGHINMMAHRNWALITTAIFVLACVWIGLQLFQSETKPKLLLLLLLFAGSTSLAITGYKGAANVYEHGLGVQRLPDSNGHDHAAHGHGNADAADHHASHEKSHHEIREAVQPHAAETHIHGHDESKHTH